MPRVLILGATSSIARAVAEEFARHRYDLLLAGRDKEELEPIASDLAIRYGVTSSVITLDAREFASHEAALRQCLDAKGEMPFGVVLCIGYLGDQAAAQVDPAETRRILET